MYEETKSTKSEVIFTPSLSLQSFRSTHLWRVRTVRTSHRPIMIRHLPSFHNPQPAFSCNKSLEHCHRHVPYSTLFVSACLFPGIYALLHLVIHLLCKLAFGRPLRAEPATAFPCFKPLRHLPKRWAVANHPRRTCSPTTVLPNIAIGQSFLHLCHRLSTCPSNS